MFFCILPTLPQPTRLSIAYLFFVVCFEKVEVKKSNGQLKRLGFVRMIAINALVCLSNLYEYAKQSSGPLKSTVGTVESTVTTVVGPFYNQFKGVPDDLLVFLDEKVLI